MKSKFGEYLLFIAEEEQKIEVFRQRLAQSLIVERYGTYACFTRVDRANRGAVRAKDLMKFILENKRGEHGIAESDFNYVIKFFDSTFKGHFIYEDFM